MPHIGAPIDTHDGQDNRTGIRPSTGQDLDKLDGDELEERLRDVLELDDE